MRTAFFEYYNLSEEDYENLWNHALVVFDTNVLLSLYRLQFDARADMISVMKGFQNRLWMPFQIGYEYHENRLGEACRPIESLRSLNDKVAKFAKEIEDNYGKNPYIKDFKNISRAIKSMGDKIKKQLGECLNDCPNFMREDSILSELTKLYEGKVGEAYSDERLNEIFVIGEDRYTKKIPPGYIDTGKNTGDRHRFGDLIIWFQIIEKSKNDGCDIIFVTDDKKEDWWQLYNGNKIGPRRELITEFRKETGNHIIGFFTPDRFLSVANKRKAVSIKKKTIEEVKYSDIIAVGRDALFGESALPGQVSKKSFPSSPFGMFGESSPVNLSLTQRLDSDMISLARTGRTDLSKSVGLFGPSEVQPRIREQDKLDAMSPIQDANASITGNTPPKVFEKEQGKEVDNKKEKG